MEYVKKTWRRRIYFKGYILAVRSDGNAVFYNRYAYNPQQRLADDLPVWQSLFQQRYFVYFKQFSDFNDQFGAYFIICTAFAAQRIVYQLFYYFDPWIVEIMRQL